MFRKPPSKLEQLQDATVNALDSLRDAVADLPADRVSKTVAQRTEAARRAAAAARQHAAATAATVAAGAGQTAAQPLETARERTAGAASGAVAGVSQAAHTTGEVLSGVAQHAGEAVSQAAHAVSDAVTGVVGSAGGAVHGAVHGVENRWQSLRGRAGDAAENAGERAHEAQESAAGWLHFGGRRAVDASAQASDAAHDWSETAREAAINAAALAAAKAASARHMLSRHSVTLPAPVEVEEKESSSRWLWMVVGVLAGAAIMLLFAPASGRRNRALVKDKLRKAKHEAKALGDSAVHKAADLKRRAEGALHERTAGSDDDADDITIADRVRTTLGESAATRNLERINVDCVDGLVTLRGPMADAALQAEIEAVVRGVKGVREVKLDLLLDESTEDSPTFVG
jgi:gas vesicle protein